MECGSHFYKMPSVGVLGTIRKLFCSLLCLCPSRVFSVCGKAIRCAGICLLSFAYVRPGTDPSLSPARRKCPGGSHWGSGCTQPPKLCCLTMLTWQGEAFLHQGLRFYLFSYFTCQFIHSFITQTAREHPVFRGSRGPREQRSAAGEQAWSLLPASSQCSFPHQRGAAPFHEM